MPTATATIENAGTLPWSAEDIARVQQVPGVLSVSAAGSPSLMTIQLSPVKPSVTVRNIAKLFPDLPIKWSMA